MKTHLADEIIQGPLRGVRFWAYRLGSTFTDPSRTITSFQHENKWVASRPTRSGRWSGLEPTMENGRGINVYKTIADAMRGSADAVNGVIGDQSEGWASCQGGLVLGEVEFWGPSVECEFGYYAQYVKPTKFLRGWGYQPEQMVDDLNLLWFANGTSLSYSERIMLTIQRNAIVTVPDIGDKLQSIIDILTKLEAKDFVCWQHAVYDDGVMYQPQKDIAWEQRVCLRCHRPAPENGSCGGCKPRLYQLTLAGQDALLAALRGEAHG